jgi:uroporphyrinogen III methyltransferase/synthase
VAAAGAAVLKGVAVASIGPITTRTARELGIAVTVEAAVFSAGGLVDAIVGLYTEVTHPSSE